MGTSPLSTGSVGRGFWCGAGTSCSLGTFAVQISLPIFNYHRGGCGTSPVCLPLLPVSMWLLVYILSYRTSVHLDFRHSEWWLFCSLVVILMWLWEVPSNVFTYVALLPGTLFTYIYNHVYSVFFPLIFQLDCCIYYKNSLYFNVILAILHVFIWLFSCLLNLWCFDLCKSFKFLFNQIINLFLWLWILCHALHGVSNSSTLDFHLVLFDSYSEATFSKYITISYPTVSLITIILL